jgi:hypothetical protein
MFYFIESATIIIFFARLVHFQGGEGVVKKSTFCTLVIMMKKMDIFVIFGDNASLRCLIMAGPNFQNCGAFPQNDNLVTKSKKVVVLGHQEIQPF